MDKVNNYDVVIIGGGAAGLSAALVLVRAHRTVLVIDNNKQSNLVSSAAHGVFTRDGTAPQEMYDIARRQLLGYKDFSLNNSIVMDIKKSNQFLVTLSDDVTVNAQSILLAQGVNYSLPNIPGLQELWGNKVWHCPFCHGYEATNKKVLVIGDESKLAHSKQLIPLWTSNAQFELIENIQSVSDKDDGILVTYADNRTEAFDGIFASTTPLPRDSIADNLGCNRNAQGILVVDEFGKTNIDGVYAAGDQASMMQQVNLAVASGHKAGMAMVMQG